ncbi:hypothetical protein [Pajaroellobacter abortibovis]|nr:hypothetical protein [Pajaroellobacter abortibovis]
MLKDVTFTNDKGISRATEVYNHLVGQGQKTKHLSVTFNPILIAMKSYSSRSNDFEKGVPLYSVNGAQITKI